MIEGVAYARTHSPTDLMIGLLSMTRIEESGANERISVQAT